MCDILKKVIDSNDFTTGGGSAAAIAGSMAAGLVGMVANLSTKKDYGFTKEKYRKIAYEADYIARELLNGAKKDTEAFSKIKEALSLPKNTDDEKSKRRKAIEEAAIEAANVPKNNALLCKRVYELSMLLEGNSNPSAASDLQEAKVLANAGIIGGVLNIEANLSLIRDEEVKTNLKITAQELKDFYYQERVNLGTDNNSL